MAAENSASLSLFGIPCDIPDDWNNVSLYRFVAPATDDIGTDMPTASKSVQFRDNLVVTRTPMPPNVGFDGFLEHSNARAKQQDPSFKVLQSGNGTLDGQSATWQDTVQSAPGAKAPIYQRSIVIPGPDGFVTLFVITARKHTLDAMTQKLPFSQA